MRMYTGREVGISESWTGWRIAKENLISPNGLSITSNKVLTGTRSTTGSNAFRSLQEL
ncbi:DUF3653 domain-containing protein [Photobacterium indicum]|uniref:DUF3653 domain-containing protein n=1 Tax=Photobacterium indicum TaxID=81447 RepID=UPI0031834BD5